jgi:tripartite-type tricarboxylate transporter receptor subunit TctC
MNRLLATVTASLLFLLQPTAHAESAANFPSRPLRLVVPFAPGGPTDVVARAVGQYMTEIMKNSVVVENRPGAAGVVGADYVAKSAGDGYTLLLCSAGAMAINPSLMPNMPYVPLRDLQPISHVVSIPYLLLVSPTSSMHSLSDLIREAKARPGKFNFGSAGLGSTSHLAGELLKTTAKIDMVHIPYKGSALADQDLLGGRLDMIFDAVPPALPLVRADKLRALAVASDVRLPVLPDVPTFKEAGLPGFEVSTWLGICTSAATPPDIVAKLNHVIVEGAKRESSVKLFRSIGGEVVANSPQAFREFIVQEQKRWSTVIKEAGITAVQ